MFRSLLLLSTMAIVTAIPADLVIPESDAPLSLTEASIRAQVDTNRAPDKFSKDSGDRFEEEQANEQPADTHAETSIADARPADATVQLDQYLSPADIIRARCMLYNFESNFAWALDSIPKLEVPYCNLKGGALPLDYGRGTGFMIHDKGWCEDTKPWYSSGCEKWGLMWYPKCRHGYHNSACCICTKSCPTNHHTVPCGTWGCGISSGACADDFGAKLLAIIGTASNLAGPIGKGLKAVKKISKAASKATKVKAFATAMGKKVYNEVKKGLKKFVKDKKNQDKDEYMEEVIVEASAIIEGQIIASEDSEAQKQMAELLDAIDVLGVGDLIKAFKKPVCDSVLLEYSSILDCTEDLPVRIRLGINENICLHNWGSKLENGNRVDLWNCDSEHYDKHQEWSVWDDNKIHLNNGEGTFCLHNWYGKAANKNRVDLYECSDGSNKEQEWVFEDRKIKLKANKGYCLHNAWGADVAGNEMYLYQCSAQYDQSQHWYLENAGDSFVSETKPAPAEEARRRSDNRRRRAKLQTRRRRAK